MARTKRLIGRILILTLLVSIASYAVYRFRALQESQRPLRLLGLESYHDVTGVGNWTSESNLPPELKTAILESYLQSWTAWNLVLLGDGEQRLERHFSGPALLKIQTGLTKQSGIVVQKDREHQLTLKFLSDDLTVAEFTDVVVVERAVLRDGNSLPLDKSEELYEVLMILQDGLWRVEQWKRSLPEQ